jgi:hypothetical protein
VIAYSQRLIVNDVLRADTASNCIVDLGDQLVRAGWTLVRTVAGGAVYEATSPDSVDYKARLLIQDDTNWKVDNPHIDLYNFRSVVLQVMNVAETVKSFYHQIRADAFYSYFQTVIGRCQVFLSVPGHDGTAWSSFACGIPALPRVGTCTSGLTLSTITDMWWSCGGSQWGFDFRSNANCYACMCYYLNGVLVTAPDNNSISPALGYLCLFPLTSPDTYSSGAINWPSITYSAHARLNIDAFLGWQWKIRGQLWDAFLQTAESSLDALASYLDQDASGGIFTVSTIVWHSEFYSSLTLVTGVTGSGVSNNAY